VIEVAKTHSINKAAENLYMNQPNLSRAIKEFEESLGIHIFSRNSKGISLTQRGEEFLVYARKLIEQVDEIENKYKAATKQKFSASVPRASYIAAAFTEFAKKLDQSLPIEIMYKETNTIRAIDNILRNDYNLGIIRYQQIYDGKFKKMLYQKGLDCEFICEFHHMLLMAKSNPLASKPEIEYADLAGCVEIAHSDPYVPSLPIFEVRKEEYIDNIDKRIFIFERGSQFDLLQNVPNTVMWVSPVPQQILDKYDLLQIPCTSDKRVYRDMLIYHNGYKLSELDNLFVTEVCKAKRQYI
jgi:DNA-binding transcriptional LysR family regulator